MHRAFLPAIRRKYSTETTTSALPVQPTKVIVKKKGGLVEAVVGFIVGAAAVGSAGYWTLVEQYQHQSQLVISSVEAVEQHVAKVKKSVSQIEKLQAELASFKETVAKKEDLAVLKSEIFKSFHSGYDELVELKSRVWTIEDNLIPAKPSKK